MYHYGWQSSLVGLYNGVYVCVYIYTIVNFFRCNHYSLFIFLCAHNTYVCYDRLLFLFFYSFNISVCMEYTGTGLENMLREFTDGQPLPACFYVP